MVGLSAEELDAARLLSSTHSYKSAAKYNKQKNISSVSFQCKRTACYAAKLIFQNP
jgi:hypothetical protein